MAVILPLGAPVRSVQPFLGVPVDPKFVCDSEAGACSDERRPPEEALAVSGFVET